MYGMIHRALRQMVLDSAGKHVWSEIEAAAGIGQSQLISVEIYDDEVTLALLASAAKCMKIDVTELLFDFGRYWVRYADYGAYSALLNFTGDDIVTFLQNLDRLHGSVQSVMPAARMPSFTVLSQGPSELLVNYASPRQGLEPFVKGLLHGLLDRFSLEGDVAIKSTENGSTQFLVNYRPGAGQ